MNPLHNNLMPFKIIAEATTESMAIPVSWALASVSALALAISGLAKMLYSSQNKRIEHLEKQIKSVQSINESQAEMIKQQNQINLNLQKDIADLKARLRKHENCQEG